MSYLKKKRIKKEIEENIELVKFMLDEMPLLTIGLSTLFGTAGGCISYDFSNWDKVNEFKARYYEAIGEKPGGMLLINCKHGILTL
jgi:hypothetical protein